MVKAERYIPIIPSETAIAEGKNEKARYLIQMTIHPALNELTLMLYAFISSCPDLFNSLATIHAITKVIITPVNPANDVVNISLLIAGTV